jgi:hypothetical protein
MSKLASGCWSFATNACGAGKVTLVVQLPKAASPVAEGGSGVAQVAFRPKAACGISGGVSI